MIITILRFQYQAFLFHKCNIIMTSFPTKSPRHQISSAKLGDHPKRQKPIERYSWQTYSPFMGAMVALKP